MTSQRGKQTIVIVLPNILRNKDNQTIKSGQLRKYNMKNIFLEKKKHTQNRVDKVVPDLFLKS